MEKAEINKLIERYNELVAKYDYPGSQKVVNLTPLEGMIAEVPIEAHRDEEFLSIHNTLMAIQEKEEQLHRQQEQEEIQKLVELGIDEVNRLLEEHTVGYVDAPTGLGGTTKLRQVDDAAFCRRLVEAQRICEETTKKTK